MEFAADVERPEGGTPVEIEEVQYACGAIGGPAGADSPGECCADSVLAEVPVPIHYPESY